MPAIHNPNWFYTSSSISPNIGFSTFSFSNTLTFSSSLSPSLSHSQFSGNDGVLRLLMQPQRSPAPTFIQFLVSVEMQRSKRSKHLIASLLASIILI